MQFKGLLYRKLKELAEKGKREQKRIEEDITRETHEAISELESFMTKDVKKVKNIVI